MMTLKIIIMMQIMTTMCTLNLEFQTLSIEILLKTTLVMKRMERNASS